MAFFYKTNVNNAFQTATLRQNVIIANGVTINDGTLVRFLNGQATIATAGSVVGGIARLYSPVITVTGDGATITCDVEILRQGDVLETPQLAITDANCQVGDPLDIAANGLDVAASGNNELVVFDRNTAANLLWVTVAAANHQFI